MKKQPVCRQSGLMPLLYKVETIWGTAALTEYWERILRYYRQFYRQKAVANYRLMKWLHENAASLKKTATGKLLQRFGRRH